MLEVQLLGGVMGLQVMHVQPNQVTNFEVRNGIMVGAGADFVLCVGNLELAVEEQVDVP